MNLFSDIIMGRSLFRQRIDWVLSDPPPFDDRAGRAVRPAWDRDRLYFCVRPFAADGRGEVLQYAFADDQGNVVMSTFARALRPTPPPVSPGLPAPLGLAIDPVDPEALEYLLTRLCGGAVLIGFGRVLQAGLLPPGVAASAGAVECAWRRFLKLARRRGMRPEWRQPLTLADAMAIAGLPPVDSEDGALRALAIRSLWNWMDRVE